MKKKNKPFLFIKLFIVLALILGVYIMGEKRIKPIINTLALSKSQNLVTMIVNNTVSKLLSDRKYEYSDFVNTKYNSQGKISSLQSNSINVNRLKSEVSVCITKAIEEIRESKINIAAGALTGSAFLTGRGPKINLKVNISCSSSIEVRNTFEYSGINQTLHKTLLDITTYIYVLSVGNTLTSKVITSIPIAETVIIGDIPEIYAGRDDKLWQELVD